MCSHVYVLGVFKPHWKIDTANLLIEKAFYPIFGNELLESQIAVTELSVKNVHVGKY
jgi:hypothetical protein